MYFTPALSLTTAIIEFMLALILLFLFRKTVLTRLGAYLVFLLGFYQLSEFMICMSIHPMLWARFGFITYTFLPAIALHAVLELRGKTKLTALIYFQPTVFAMLSAHSSFITDVGCQQFFVILRHIIFDETHLLAFIVYISYFYVYIALACFVAWKNYMLEHDKTLKKLNMLMLTAFLSTLLPALAFLMIFPKISYYFPSVFSRFSIIIAILIFIGAIVEFKAQTIDLKNISKKYNKIKSKLN